MTACPLALLVVVKWCLGLPENSVLGEVEVSVLSWRWKGVVECICLLLYSNLKVGYLTNISKSNHNLKIFFFQPHLCTVPQVFLCWDTNRIKSYWLKPGVLCLITFHRGLVGAVYTPPSAKPRSCCPPIHGIGFVIAGKVLVQWRLTLYIVYKRTNFCHQLNLCAITLQASILGSNQILVYLQLKAEALFPSKRKST